jgi:predicted enzyme related to lactoylglutathione lyase
MGSNALYSVFQLEGRDTAAAYTLRGEQRSQDVPAHWMLHVAVPSADDAADRASHLGGKVLAEAFDVFDAGRMAVLEDPTRARFCVWQPRKHTGMDIAARNYQL